MVVDMRLSPSGKFVPAIADIDVQLFKSPQQRGSIGNIEVLVGRFCADLPIVQLEHAIIFLERQMEEAGMPPKMTHKIAAIAPLFLGTLNPGNAVSRPTLHFHDVSNRMASPKIFWILLHRLPTEALRSVVLACLFQTIGHAPHQKTVAGHLRIPRRQDPCDRIADILTPPEIRSN